MRTRGLLTIKSSRMQRFMRSVEWCKNVIFILDNINFGTVDCETGTEDLIYTSCLLCIIAKFTIALPYNAIFS